MADIEWGQGNLAPAVGYKLTAPGPDGLLGPLDLTTATGVTFRMVRVGCLWAKATVVACTFLGPRVEGVVRLAPTVALTKDWGVFWGQFVVAYPGATTITRPVNRFLDVRVFARAGA